MHFAISPFITLLKFFISHSLKKKTENESLVQAKMKRAPIFLLNTFFMAFSVANSGELHVFMLNYQSSR